MKVDTAIVLVGGPGSRLRPLTNDLPKGMIKVYGKPLLQWIIEWIRDNEIRKIVLGIAYFKDRITDYFGDGTDFGVEIRYSVHTVKGGTCEGFRLAISRNVDRDVFFAMNGDQITDLNLNNLASFHMKHNPIATLAVINPRCPYGHVRANEEYNITGFVEKPLCPYTLCNAGIYVFNREILSYLPEKGDIEKTTFPTLAKLHCLKIYPFSGVFITANTSKDLDEAERKLRMIHK